MVGNKNVHADSCSAQEPWSKTGCWWRCLHIVEHREKRHDTTCQSTKHKTRHGTACQSTKHKTRHSMSISTKSMTWRSVWTSNTQGLKIEKDSDVEKRRIMIYSREESTYREKRSTDVSIRHWMDEEMKWDDSLLMTSSRGAGRCWKAVHQGEKVEVWRNGCQGNI